MATITTIHGDMEEDLLEKRTGSDDTPSEVSDWIEYWYNGELVHRSVHVHLKEGPVLTSTTAIFG